MGFQVKLMLVPSYFSIQRHYLPLIVLLFAFLMHKVLDTTVKAIIFEFCFQSF